MDVPIVSLLPIAVSRESNTQVYHSTYLKLAFLSQITFILKICREHDAFLSNWKVSVCFFFLLFVFVSVIEWCLIIELTQL